MRVETLYLTVLILLLFFLVLIPRRTRRVAAARHILKNNREGVAFMEELAYQFLNMECLIYTITDTSGIQGVVKEVSGGGIVIQSKDSLQAMNLEYVTRIREYPRSKNGKKKSIVTD